MRQLRLNTLKIDPTNGIFDAHLNVVRFQDIDTLQYIAYIPTLELSGYGKNQNDANVMLEFSIIEFFKLLHTLKPHQQRRELLKLGWKQITS